MCEQTTKEYKPTISGKKRPSVPVMLCHSLQAGLPCGIIGERNEGWTGGKEDGRM